MNPLALRFVIAGSVIVVGGIAIAVTGAGVGEGAEWKGAVVIAAGAGLIVSGWMKRAGAVRNAGHETEVDPQRHGGSRDHS